MKKILMGGSAGVTYTPLGDGATTMGCKVDAVPCSICSQGEPHEHYDPEHPNRVQYLNPAPTFLYATTVPAPRCESCGVSLVVYEDKDWVCADTSCAVVGGVVFVHWLQVFPMKGAL